LLGIEVTEQEKTDTST